MKERSYMSINEESRIVQSLIQDVANEHFGEASLESAGLLNIFAQAKEKVLDAISRLETRRKLKLKKEVFFGYPLGEHVREARDALKGPIPLEDLRPTLEKREGEYYKTIAYYMLEDSPNPLISICRADMRLANVSKAVLHTIQQRLEAYYDVLESLTRGKPSSTTLSVVDETFAKVVEPHALVTAVNKNITFYTLAYLPVATKDKNVDLVMVAKEESKDYGGLTFNYLDLDIVEITGRPSVKEMSDFIVPKPDELDYLLNYTQQDRNKFYQQDLRRYYKACVDQLTLINDFSKKINKVWRGSIPFTRALVKQVAKEVQFMVKFSTKTLEIEAELAAHVEYYLFVMTEYYLKQKRG